MKQHMAMKGMVGIAFACLAGCSGVYFNTLEQFGIEKRDVLVDRVEDAQESQEEAKEAFQSALEHFMSVVEVDGGDLEKIYNRLSSEYNRLEGRATAVSSRIDRVEKVALALFREWESELDEYSRGDLREASARQLESTRKDYQTLIDLMRRAEGRMQPVLNAFSDQVLFLKHNLNARAIQSIRGEAMKVEGEVDSLVAEMNAAIEEAEAFITKMR